MADENLKVLRRRDVLARCGLKQSQLYRLMGAGTFPRPVRLGVRSVGWLSHEIDAWILARMNEPRAGIAE